MVTPWCLKETSPWTLRNKQLTSIMVFHCFGSFGIQCFSEKMISGLKGLRWPATLKTLMFLGIFKESFVFFGVNLPVVLVATWRWFLNKCKLLEGEWVKEGDNKEVNPSIDRFFGVMVHPWHSNQPENWGKSLWRWSKAAVGATWAMKPEKNMANSYK